MAVLYRPITFQKGDLYLIEEYEGSDKYSEIMEDAPVNVALGAVVFFYRLGNVLSSYLLDSLTEQMMKDKEMVKDLEQNGGGINQYTQSLKEMSQNLKKLQNYQLPNV
jgi:6-phosphogluconate dehydrogenase (decarboxylating)